MKEGLARWMEKGSTRLGRHLFPAQASRARPHACALCWSSYFKLGLLPANKTALRATDKHTAASADGAQGAVEFVCDLPKASVARNANQKRKATSLAVAKGSLEPDGEAPAVR